jgi:hypothetical protein
MKKTISESKRMKKLAGLLKESQEDQAIQDQENVEKALDALNQLYISDFAHVLDSMADEYDYSDFESISVTGPKIRQLSKILFKAAINQQKEEEGG